MTLNNKQSHRQCLLLGLVEILKPMGHLTRDERVQVAHMCHEAVYGGTGHTGARFQDPQPWLGHCEKGHMGVEIHLDEETVQVLNDDYLVSRYWLTGVIAIVVIRRTSGHLVIIGKCQKKQQRLGIVLDLQSTQEADSFIRDYKVFRETRKTTASPLPDLLQQATISPPELPPRPPLENIQNRPLPPPPTPPPTSSEASNPNQTYSIYSANILAKKPQNIRTTSTPSLGPPPMCPLPEPPVPRLPPKKVSTEPNYQDLTPNPVKVPKKPKPSLFSREPVTGPSQNQDNPPKAQQLPNEGKNREKSKTKQFIASFSPFHREPKEDDVMDCSFNVIYEPFPNDCDNTFLLGNPGTSTVKPKEKTKFKGLKLNDKTKDKTLFPLHLGTVSKSSSSVPAKGQTFSLTTPLNSKSEIRSRTLSSDMFDRPLPPLPTTSQSSSPTPSSLTPSSSTPISPTPITSTPSSPTPQPALCSGPSSFSSSRNSSVISDSSDTSSNDTDEEDDFYSNEEDYHDNDEEYYSKWGIDVKESERMYIADVSTALQQRKKTPSTLEADINKLLIDEYHYLSTIGQISEARKILNPKLQGLLQGVDKLVDVHNNMYTELYEGYQSCSRIAQVFLSRRDELAPYAYYLMNAPTIGQQLLELPEGVRAQYPSLKQNIMTSWKRLNFYFLSLENMLKNTPAEDVEVVQQAVEMFQEMSRKGDSGILMDAVKGTPFNIHTLAPLLLHNMFNIKFSNRTMVKLGCRVLLFKEMLIVTVPKKDHCEYEDHLPINQLKFGGVDSDADTQFVLEKIRGGKKKNKRYIFRSPTVAIKDVWISKINWLLNRHADEIKKITGLRYGLD